MFYEMTQVSRGHKYVECLRLQEKMFDRFK